MNYVKKTILVLSLFTIALFSNPNDVKAASFNLDSTSEIFAVGQEISVDVIIDSESEEINAAQTSLKFSNNILEVTKIEKSKSVFNFWLIDPSFSNQNGDLSFVGGVSGGLSGKNLHIMKVFFKIKGIGQAEINFNDSAITSADGLGTNVLTLTNGLKIKVVEANQIKEIESSIDAITQLEKPTDIVAKGVPSKPEIEVKTYPDQTKWYNFHSKFSANWNLPSDVTDVLTILDQNPKTNPTKSEGLFNQKTFSINEDGIWYLHVRFKNSKGLSETLHYKISIDTTPPLSFEIKHTERDSNDTPLLNISYNTSDELSRIKVYSIKIDGVVIDSTENQSFIVNKIPPGKRRISVTAEDFAENKISNFIDIEVIPIESPKIISVSKAYSGEGDLSVKGVSTVGKITLVSLFNKQGAKIESIQANVDSSQLWVAVFKNILQKGEYYIEAIAEDERGAQSFPEKYSPLKISERPILSIGGFDITAMTLIYIIMGMILAYAIIISFINKNNKLQIQRKIIIAERDVSNALESSEKEIDQILAEHTNGKLNKTKENEINFKLEETANKLKKNRKYILENIDEIDD